MTTIGLSANDQLLAVTLNPKIASGNQNTVTLHVDFSEDWSRFGKSAVFFTSNDTNTIYEKVLTSGECIVPAEVMSKDGILYIGVRGVNSQNNEVKTTSLVKYKISEGSPSGTGTEVEPTPDVYQQLLTAYGMTDSAIAKEVVDRKAEIAVERARIDNLSTLKEGSTTGDAELMDIRVKADGTIATSAGNAVREQVSELKSDISDLDDLFEWNKEKTNLLSKYTPVDGEYVDYSNGCTGFVSTYQYFQLPVTAGEKYHVNLDNVHVAFFSRYYDGLTAAYYVSGILAQKYVEFEVPQNATYMTVSVDKSFYAWLCYSNVEYKDNTTLKKDCLPEYNDVIIVGGTDGTYSNLVKAVKECQEGYTIIVRSGIYDLESQFKEVYGNDFFTNYNGYFSDNNFELSGLYLKRGVKLIADSGTVLSFMYSGNNPKVSEEFSPINLTVDNIVDGFIIEVNSNVRYHIHDDFAFMAFMNVNNYGQNEIKNCIFKGNPTCGSVIGGGMGSYCRYLIHDNYFENTIGNAITYHNASFSIAQNFIDIFNNYSETPIKLWWYGESTKITTALVHNNTSSLIECTAIQGYDAPNENIRMKAWNNNIIS